jgi:hypothetical protein
MTPLNKMEIIPNQPKQLLTADEAVEYLGYDNKEQFQRAVKHGILPRAFDPNCKAPRWSRPQIDAFLRGEHASNRRNPANELDNRLGLS